MTFHKADPSLAAEAHAGALFITVYRCAMAGFSGYGDTLLNPQSVPSLATHPRESSMARITRFAVHSLSHRDRGEALGRAVGETHRRYSAVVNSRKRVTGHVFQSRYGSVVMDEGHLLAAAR
jgi:hypothetical protein